MYGFGDRRTREHSVFQLGTGPAEGFEDVLARYKNEARTVELSGPTNFAPIILKTIEIVKATREYTILLLICDGQVDEQCKRATEAAIVEATDHPISIIICGVGDGPWGEMERYDDSESFTDETRKRKFDNLQFVPFSDIQALHSDHRDTRFAVEALQEIPAQFSAIQRLGLLRTRSGGGGGASRGSNGEPHLN